MPWTKEDLEARKRKAEARRTLLARLDAGDELHREAAEEIRLQREAVNEAIRDGEAGARDAYHSGREEEARDHEQRW